MSNSTLTHSGFERRSGLEVRDLAVRRGYRLLFSALNFQIDSGEILQLTGQNGTGKSTLLRVIAGFSKPDAGTMMLKGALEDQAPTALLHYHGHKDGLREALTATENLTFFAGVMGGDITRLRPALARLGAEALADLPVQVLSAGQRRRVSLARLLMVDRPIWLLDEPFTALDTAGQGIVAQLLDAHRAAGGLAIVATHQALPFETRQLALSGFKTETRSAT